MLSIVTVMASIFGGAIFWVAKANSLSRLKNSWDSADRITKGKLELQLACCGFSKGISINECAVSNPKEFCGDVIHDTQYPILIAQITISFAGIALLFMTYLISGHLRRKYRLVNQNLDIERRERRTKQKHDRHINDEGRENPNSPNHDSPSTSADNHKTAGLKGITALPESFRQLAEKKSPISLRNKNPLESDRLARN